MSHLKTKIKRPVFGKMIYKFLFNSGDRISKEKKLWKFLESKL